MGCTTDWVHRWNNKAIGGYKHYGFEKMFILFFSDRCNCKGDAELEKMFPDAEERQRYKDGDRSNGRLEKRLFFLCDDYGENRNGFLNVGTGSEGLPNGKVWGVTYLATMLEESVAVMEKESEDPESHVGVDGSLLEKYIE